jgi:hypothetical protein
MAFSAYGASSEAARRLLENARENLRISQATEKRIASELAQLKRSANASPQVIKDYEIYLQRVQAMVAENRKIVRDMEAAYARYAPSETQGISASSDEVESMLDSRIPEQQEVDELAALDKELNESLSSAGKMQDLAEEAAAAAKRLREKGVDLDSSSDESAESEAEETDEENESEAEKESTDNRNEQASKEGKEEGQVAKSDSSREGAEGTPRKESRHGSGEDDDIVA